MTGSRFLPCWAVAEHGWIEATTATRATTGRLAGHQYKSSASSASWPDSSEMHESISSYPAEAGRLPALDRMANRSTEKRLEADRFVHDFHRHGILGQEEKPASGPSSRRCHNESL